MGRTCTTWPSSNSSWLLDEIFAGEAQPDWLATLLPIDARSADDRLARIEGEPLDRHLERLERIRAYLIERLTPMSNADLHTIRRLEPYDVAPDWVLHHLLQHEAEHRAHIAYVRDWFIETEGG